MMLARRKFIELSAILSFTGMIGYSRSGLDSDYEGLVIGLVRDTGLSNRQFFRLLRDNAREYPTVFLFPEHTFKYKFTAPEIQDLCKGIDMPENAYAFFSAFVLEDEKVAESRIKEVLRQEDAEEGSPGAYLLGKLFERRYVNHGFLVSRGSTENSIVSYAKHIVTSFDSLNGDTSSKRIGSNPGGNVVGVEYGDDVDFYKEKVTFPAIDIGGTSLEFRLCADIECGTVNEADIILVSARYLEHVAERTKKSLNDNLLIVNDRGFRKSPIGYENGKPYKTLSELSSACEGRGIKVCFVG